jgi:3D (Asp-Asp-Asp) domain-containing protein
MINIIPTIYRYFGLLSDKAKKHAKSLVLMVFLPVFFLPQLSESQGAGKELMAGPVVTEKLFAYREGAALSKIARKEPRKTMVMTVTAYSSEVGQTDSTPFITAFGTHVRDGIVATNCLPKGALVRFPEAFGDKEFVVEDRMNSRYYYRMDIWMAETQDAINFGAKTLKVEIL